jgi:putative membrane protein
MTSITGKPAVAAALVALVAALHVYFLVLEMFLWQTPYGMETFGSTPEFAAASAVLAANGGRSILTFFLLCVLVAGCYGGATVHPRILLVQGLPALLALAAVWRTRG